MSWLTKLASQRSGRPHPGYVFVVISLSAMILGLFACPAPIPHYEVSTTVSRPRFRQDRPGGLDGDSKQLLTEPYLQRLEEMKLLRRTSAGADIRLSSKVLQPFRVEYVLTVTEQGKADAQIFAKRLTQDFVSWQNRQGSKATSKRSRLENGGLARAKRRVQVARQELFNFVNKRLHNWVRELKVTQVEPSSAGPPTQETTPAPPSVSKELNPRWQRLKDQVDKLSEQLDTLQQRTTEQHPSYRFAALQLDNLRERLSKTPQYSVQSQPTVDAPKPERTAKIERLPPVDNVALAKISDRLGELSRKWDEATSSLDQIQKQYVEESLDQAGSAGWIVSSGQTVNRIPTTLETRLLWGIMGISLGAGLFFALLSAGLGRVKLETTHDVAAAVAAPLISVVPAVSPASASTDNTRAAIVRGVQRGAELVLLVSAASFLVLCTSSDRLGEFAYDPIGALVQVLPI